MHCLLYSSIVETYSDIWLWLCCLHMSHSNILDYAIHLNNIAVAMACWNIHLSTAIWEYIFFLLFTFVVKTLTGVHTNTIGDNWIKRGLNSYARINNSKTISIMYNSHLIENTNIICKRFECQSKCVILSIQSCRICRHRC